MTLNVPLNSLPGIHRRDFLSASTIAVLGGAVASSSNLRAALPDENIGHATLRVGDLTAVIGDNSADDEHRAGYNGIWSLQHSAATRSVFVPAVAGLNLEHIVTGEQLDDGKIFFEPRNAAMNFRKLDDHSAELHQPPTPTFHVESWTQFQLVAPHYLDMTFRCKAHQPVFSRGYLRAVLGQLYQRACRQEHVFSRRVRRAERLVDAVLHAMAQRPEHSAASR